MFDLPHVASRVFGSPLMIARAKLEVILGALAPRFGGQALEPIGRNTDTSPPTPVTAEGIAVIPVIGTLVARSGYLDSASGLQTYGEIGDAVAEAMGDPAIRGIILDIDSSGGEVGGLFDLADRIGAIKTASGKPLWAVANEAALSAAYAIASTADRLYVTRTAEVGSVGVVAVHVDESGADAKAGLAWNFVFAGDHKIDGNVHAPLTEQGRAAIQVDVDQLYQQFCALVAINRDMTIEAVRGTEAAIFRGELAIRAGLADRLGTLDTAIAGMATDLRVKPGNSPAAPILRTPNNPAAKRSPSMATKDTENIEAASAGPGPAPIPPAPDSAEADPDRVFQPPQVKLPSPSTQEPAANAADKLRAEYAEIADIAAQAARLGVTVEAADAMRKGIKPEALRRSVLDALATRAEASSIIAAAPSTPTTGDSPIVRRARERAASARK